MYYRGRTLKRIHLKENECIDVIHRPDGGFQFIHRVPCSDNFASPPPFESGIYISAEAAETAARLKFNL